MSERWRSVVSHDGLYEVSSFGRVKSLGRTKEYPGGYKKSFPSKILKPRRVNGYFHVTLTDNFKNKLQISIHYLVATAFIGPRPDGMQIDHINAVKTDNRVENLEWVSRSENTKRAFRLELMTGIQRGEDVNFSRLTEKVVMDIVAMHKSGYKKYKIAEKFGVAGSTVSSICRGQTWGWLTGIEKVREKRV
jgi:hypothetical protein